MKVYKVKVNGKVYEVELEAVSETNGHIDVPKAEAAPAAAPVSSGEGTTLLAPIGGKVLDIKVNVGDTVKKGQTVAIIEAMKLENEIKANADGVIREIKTSKGAIVQSKDALLIIG